MSKSPEQSAFIDHSTDRTWVAEQGQNDEVVLEEVHSTRQAESGTCCTRGQPSLVARVRVQDTILISSSEQREDEGVSKSEARTCPW